MTKATVHERIHHHRGRVIDVGTEDVTLPSGLRVKLDVIKHPGASGVLPLSADGKVTLIHQFRHCADGWLWEAPAGTLEPGESPYDCAHRETIEEAGLIPGELRPVGHIFTAPGFTDEKIYLWLALHCTNAPQKLDDDEVITEVKQVSEAEVDDMLRRGEICDAKTISVLMQARIHMR
jgi:ADP-ribose pyrophosphatase